MKRPKEGPPAILTPKQVLETSGQEALLPDDAVDDMPHSFYDNIQIFLGSKAKAVELPGDLNCWSLELRKGIQLYVYEELVTEANYVCDQCRIIGWGIHPVCRVKYHFIVPSETGADSVEDSSSLAGITEACRSGKEHGDSIRLPTKVLHETAEYQSSVYNADPTIYDSTRHRLHGVIHANGFGHLLRINGMYGGSSSATGLQILALWDALCSRLNVRKITVEDVSSKSGMELRIAYFLAYGQTWYGLLGYDFGRGPYNISQDRWRDAGTFISSIAISHILQDFEGVEQTVPAIISRYTLPVGEAAHVRDFGALMYRLLYLQLNPKDALQFFDEEKLEKARLKVSCTENRAGNPAVRRKMKKKSAKFSLPKKRIYSGQSKNTGTKVNLIKHDTNKQNGIEKPMNSKRGKAKVESQCSKQGHLGLQTDPTLKPSSVEDIQMGSELQLLFRGKLVDGKVIALPVNRGRMHRLEFSNRKTRKFDLMITPWRFKGSLAPLTTVSEDMLRIIEQKEEAKLESIKNSKNNSTNPAVLKYKANLSREDFVERSRQLCRALKSLIPASRVIFAPAKTRVEMEAAFRALVDDNGPTVTCKDSWWEFIPALLAWVQKLLGSTGPDASKCISVVDNTIEIDREYLHSIGLYPESWGIPLRQETLKEQNQEPVDNGLSKPLTNDSHKMEVDEKMSIVARRKERPSRFSEVENTAAETPAKCMSNEISSSDHEGYITKYVEDAVNNTVEALWNACLSPDGDNDEPPKQHAWHLRLPGGGLDSPNNEKEARDQVNRDLHHLFSCILKVYLPEVAKIARQNAAISLGIKPVPKPLKLRQLPEETRVLRDTKHFLKDYQLYKQPINTKKQTSSRLFRLWCSLQVPEEINMPSISNTRFGRKFIKVEPPAELISVMSDSTAAHLLDKMSKHFRSLYIMCSSFSADQILFSHGEKAIDKKGRRQVQIISATKQNDGLRLENILDMSEPLPVIQFSGHGYDLAEQWLHAGGPEDWIVNCSCGTRDDDGEAMVACDSCETWVHTRCADVPDETSHWVCDNCQKRKK